MMASSGQACVRRARSCARSIGSSSAMSAGGCLFFVCIKGNLDRGPRAMRRDLFQDEARVVGIEGAQSTPQIGQADAVADLGTESASVVDHRDGDTFSAAACFELYRAAFGLRLEPLLAGVLDPPHQQHRRNGMRNQPGNTD